MAINPEQARQMTVEEKDIVDKVESFMDDYLRKNYNGGTIIINPPSMLHMTKRVEEEIIDRYKKAGWDIKLESDQREPGKWFSLKPIR